MFRIPFCFFLALACVDATALAVAKGEKKNFFARLIADYKQGQPQDKVGFTKKCDASLLDLLPTLREEYTEGQVPQVLVHSCEAYDMKEDFNRDGDHKGIARARTRCEYFARELGTEYTGKQRYKKWCESVWNYLGSEEMSPEAARVQLKQADLIRSELDAAKQELRAVRAQNRIEVVTGGGGRDKFKKAMVPFHPPNKDGSGNSDKVLAGFGEDGKPRPIDEEQDAVLASHHEGDESLCCPDDCDVCEGFEVVRGMVRKDYGNVKASKKTEKQGTLKLPKSEPNTTQAGKRVRQLAKKVKTKGQSGHVHSHKRKRRVAHKKKAPTTVSTNSTISESTVMHARTKTPEEVDARARELHRKLRKSPSSGGSGQLPLPFADAGKSTDSIHEEVPELSTVKSAPVEGMDKMMNKSHAIDKQLDSQENKAISKHLRKQAKEDAAQRKADAAQREEETKPPREVTPAEVDEKVMEVKRKVDNPPPGREQPNPVPYGGAVTRDFSELDDMISDTSKRISKVVQKNLKVQDHDLEIDAEIEKKVDDILHGLVDKEHVRLQATGAKVAENDEDEATDEDDEEEEDEEDEDEDDKDSSSLLQKRAASRDIYHVLIKEFEQTDVFPSHIKTKPFLDRCTDIISGLMPRLQEEYTWPQVPSILMHECDVYKSAEDFKTEGKRLTHAVASCQMFATRLGDQFKHKQDYKGWCSNVYAQLLRDSGKQDLTDVQRDLLKNRRDFKDAIFDTKDFHKGGAAASHGCCPANCKMCMF